jgi:hypothetical protein
MVARLVLSMFRDASSLTDLGQWDEIAHRFGVGSAILLSSTMVDSANGVESLDVRERTAIQHIMGG